MNNLVSKKDIIAKYLLQFTIAITVFSQMETLSKICRPLMYISWFILFGYLLSINVEKIKLSSFTASYLFCYILFLGFCLFQSWIDADYKIASYLQVMVIPLLVSLISDLLRNKLSVNWLISTCKVYVFSSVIFALYINFTYFSSYQEWLASQVYLFASKNSAAQIWCSAILILYFIILPISKKKCLCYTGMTYLLILCGLSQCRTAILGLVCVLAYNILIHSKHKSKWIIIICTSMILLLLIPQSREFISQAFLLDKYAGADMNTMSSGRLGLYSKAWGEFCESPLIGVGHYYVDCSYLYILAESGIIGFLIIEFVWIKRIFSNLSNKVLAYARPYMLTSFVIFYFIESLLEGQPPFGPGASSFMFWFLSEIKVGE